MAIYGLKTETTEHLAGMRFGESSDNQDGMGGGTPLPYNCVSLVPNGPYPLLKSSYIQGDGKHLYFNGYALYVDGTSIDLPKEIRANSAVTFYSTKQSTYLSENAVCLHFDETPPSDATLLSGAGSVFLFFQ